MNPFVIFAALGAAVLLLTGDDEAPKKEAPKDPPAEPKKPKAEKPKPKETDPDDE